MVRSRWSLAPSARSSTQRTFVYPSTRSPGFQTRPWPLARFSAYLNAMYASSTSTRWRSRRHHQPNTKRIATGTAISPRTSVGFSAGVRSNCPAPLSIAPSEPRSTLEHLLPQLGRERHVGRVLAHEDLPSLRRRIDAGALQIDLLNLERRRGAERIDHAHEARLCK